MTALGDPTRRAIFESLAQKPSAVGELAARFPVSRSAVSQHLRVLKEAHLVKETTIGTRNIYRIDPEGIAALRHWLDQHWSRGLEDFKDYVDKQQKPENEK